MQEVGYLVTTWEQDIEDGKRHMAETAFHAIAAGKAFSDAKDKHRDEHGGTGWKEAVESRGLNRVLVDQFIQVFEQFGEKSDTQISNLGSTMLRQLAAPSVPEPAREEVLQRVSDGEKLTVKQTEEIIRKAKAEQAQADRERIGALEQTVSNAVRERANAERRVSALENAGSTTSGRVRDELEQAKNSLAREENKVRVLNEQLESLRKTRFQERIVDDSLRTWKSAASKAEVALSELLDASEGLNPALVGDGEVDRAEAIQSLMIRVSAVLPEREV